MSPKRLTCPKCNGELGPRIPPSAPPVAVGYKFPEFPCPHCDAILAIPNIDKAYRDLIAVLTLTALTLISLELSLFNMINNFRQGFNLALSFIPTITIGVILVAVTCVSRKKVNKNLKAEVMGIRPTCKNCEHTSVIRDAIYCTWCGADLSNSAMVECTSEERLTTADPFEEITDIRKTSEFILGVRDRLNDIAAQRQTEWTSYTCQHCGTIVALVDALFCPTCGEKLSKPRQLPNIVSPDKCMVCMEDLNPQDTIIRCPNCGSPFHTVHLLEYLHVHAGCPVCGEHLAEREITIVSSEELAPLNDGGGAS